MCERNTRNGQPRPFQRGTNEADAAVANKVHDLFREACRTDPSIFPQDSRIRLPDQKVAAVVELLQGVSFTRTDVDTIGAAFEHFFGSVFRGDLGQYFTRRRVLPGMEGTRRIGWACTLPIVHQHGTSHVQEMLSIRPSIFGRGAFAVVPERFEGALVTKEFPVFRVTDARVSPDFLSVLLRSRYYQRAFRAITTGHSNRRRTQQHDFEWLEISFPPDREEHLRLMQAIDRARQVRQRAAEDLAREQAAFDNIIDGRGDEMLPEIEVSDVESNENGAA